MGRERELAARILAERDRSAPAAPNPAPILPQSAPETPVDLTNAAPQPTQAGKGDIREQRKIWRTNRIASFTANQRRKREWINFAEIADWCSEVDGSVVPNESARASAYEKLQRDLLEGDFEENGRSRVLYLHPWTVKAKMTRQWMENMIETHPRATIRSKYLDHCWLPRNLFQRWLAKHHLPASTRSALRQRRRFRPIRHLGIDEPDSPWRRPARGFLDFPRAFQNESGLVSPRSAKGERPAPAAGRLVNAAA
jgi:hypothetical protein